MTGNAPLVEAQELKRSYKKMSESQVQLLTGYTRDAGRYVTKNTVFKIVKAHHFLKPRQKMNDYQIASTDGDILVIDEAQRTYQKGRMVIGEKPLDHEANMILKAMEKRTACYCVTNWSKSEYQSWRKRCRGLVRSRREVQWDVFISTRLYLFLNSRIGIDSSGQVTD